MALTSSDLAALDAAIAMGELEVEVAGRRVRYRSVDELIKARAHVAGVLAQSEARMGAAYRVKFATSRE